MSQTTTRDMQCRVCGGTIPAGARIERTEVGNWARCLARGAVRHALAADCSPTPAATADRQAVDAAIRELTTPATERQLAFAAELLRRDPGSAGGVTVEQLRARSRAEVSAWIDAHIRLTEGL